jgi:endogenous inhibitor of DNA gyrase (YacG/DUF329 family)
MGELIVTCPATGKKVATGIEMAGRQAPPTRMTRRCPHCGARHSLKRADATIVDVIMERRNPLVNREG